MNVTTVDRFFELYPESMASSSKQVEVAKINRRIDAVSRAVELYLGRKTEIDERLQKFTPDNGNGTKSVKLSAYPIQSITSVSIFGETQTEGIDYSVDEDLGIIYFAFPVERSIQLFENGISVIYAGGMADDVDNFILMYPDIEAEVLMQINFEIKRMGDIAMKSVANGNTSSQLNPYGFQDSLIAILDRYKRVGTP